MRRMILIMMMMMMMMLMMEMTMMIMMKMMRIIVMKEDNDNNRLLAEAQVPLSQHVGGVALLPQVLGQQEVLQRQACRLAASWQGG